MNTKTKQCANGTIIFDKQVMASRGLEDVYATTMKRGQFNTITGQSIEGDPDADGYAFLIREETTLRWSTNPTGRLVDIP